MTTKVDLGQVHDLALEMFRHLKVLEDSPEKNGHMFRMICAAERAAAGVLDDAGAEQAMKDVEEAAVFCQDR